jgi:hypothetical protein
MSDDNFFQRKKLSLKGKRVSAIQKKSQENKNSSQVEHRAMEGWERDISDINEQIKVLQVKIDQIDRRLIFGYSEALKESSVNYKKELMKLECQITDILSTKL